MDRFLTAQRGAATALDSLQIPHCDYADDIALTSNTAESLQLQLNRFYDYTRFKGLKLNTDKTKVMVFFSRYTSAIPTFTYDGTPLELVIQFKYTLESLLLVMESCSQLLRRWQTTSGLPLPEFNELVTARVSRKHAMLCFFQVFALTAGLYGCQVWATSFLTNDSSKTTPVYVLHLGFLIRLLGVKKGTDTHCMLRKTGQMHHTILKQFTLFKQSCLFLRKLCGLTFFLQIEVVPGLIRFCLCSKIFLRLSNFWLPYVLASLPI